MPRSCTVSAQSGMDRRREIRAWSGPDAGPGGIEAEMVGFLLGLGRRRRRLWLRGHFGQKREEKKVVGLSCWVLGWWYIEFEKKKKTKKKKNNRKTWNACTLIMLRFVLVCGKLLLGGSVSNQTVFQTKPKLILRFRNTGNQTCHGWLVGGDEGVLVSKNR